MSHSQKKIITDPNKYGSKGQSWAPEFVAYMAFIVNHPAYSDMPDAVKCDGKIQWEAPSNRSSGLYQFTHIKRRDWWRAKALSVDIDPSVDQWISKTAKKIHPTGEKPCKRCGLIMQIAYVYPQKNLIKRFNKIFGDSFEVSELEPINDIVQKAYDLYGSDFTKKISELFGTKNTKVPPLDNDLEEIQLWLTDVYTPSEPSLLSPGSMSNAPDRFDGFHSFNRCCRGTADTGRHDPNLKGYTTDRRVFEYWSEGDWIAADRLMGLVKTKLSSEPCADDGSGPPTADHIGPLSLGFCHRPEFKMLSKSGNSAKNNRMSLSDVLYLLECEKSGVEVASWYAKPLWDMLKLNIDNDEKSLRLSKILRDNQRNAMHILCKLFEEKKFAFLVYLLELGYADRKVEFINLHTDNFITKYDDIKSTPRTTKYSAEQKARRIRIGLQALEGYKEKDNRHLYLVLDDSISETIDSAIKAIDCVPSDINNLNKELESILFPSNGAISDFDLRDFSNKFPNHHIESFEKAKVILTTAMCFIGKELSLLWNDDRYVREELDT